MKNIFKKSSVLIVMGTFILGLTGPSTTLAATAVNLGSTSNFAILAGSTITNTGSSVITGDLGLSPGSAITGFPPGTLNGTQQIGNAAATQAKNDLIAAYNNAAGQLPVSTVSSVLGGTTKTAGVYDSSAGTFGITGTLTLDGQGDPSAVFIFKTATTLITAGSSNINLINGAQACNVFWQVGSSATLGTNSAFEGNILALTSATLTTGAHVNGRVFAQNGAVTLDSNVVTKVTCAAPIVVPTPTPAPEPLPVVIIPTPVVTSAPVIVTVPTSTPTVVITTPVVVSTPTTTVVPQAAPKLTVVPKLPNAGVAPSAPWNIIIPAGIFAVLFSLYLVKKKFTI